MANSKFIRFIHRFVGLLGLLMFGGITVRLFYLKEYFWAWLYIAILVFVLYNFIKDFFRTKPNFGGYYSLVFCSLWPCWHEYSNYKRDLRMDKFGLNYNKTRQSLGIPIIPAAWNAKSYGNRWIEWKGTGGVLGHQEKSIDLDSLYRIEYERDEYNFRSIHDTTRSISIIFHYARGKSKDSIDYRYHLKDTTFTITKHQADSLFDLAKITKDY